MTKKKTAPTGLTAIGVTCGVGSMLVGARQAGFRVLGNVEWRRYYHRADEEGRDTFTANFPGAAFPYSREQMTEDEFRRFSNPDLAMGHPECGPYSKLNMVNKNYREQKKDPGDIPLFADLVAQFRPRYFAMDDLPDSLQAFSMADYHERLKDYDLFPEWVSNYHYGNVQKNRRRMFMVGSLRSERWAFRPGEFEHSTTVRDVLEDLLNPTMRGNVPNHDVHSLDAVSPRGQHLDTLGRGREATYRDLRDWFLSNPEGTIMRYVSSDGTVKVKPSHATPYWEGHAHVLDGASLAIHPRRGTPFTVRERARLQGFPDDFVFYGTRYEPDGTYSHEANNDLIKQTGKAMPVQFCNYVARQVAAHIRSEDFQSSNRRFSPPNPLIDDAKRWYCSSVGYSDQTAACDACWLRETCEIRTKKYQLPPLGPLAQRREAAAPRDPTRPGRGMTAIGPGVPVRSRSAPRRGETRFAALPEGVSRDLDFTREKE